MRGLLGATALSLVGLASGAALSADIDKGDVEINHYRSLLSFIEIPLSHDDGQSITFELQIKESEEACGNGNIILNGQSLPQSLDGDVSSGKGSIKSHEGVVVSSWSFQCVKVNGIPDSQFMKFVIESINGKSVQDAGFSLAFRQTQLEILNIETDLSIPDQVMANPDHEKLQPAEWEMDSNYGIHEDLEELDYLYSQLREIKYLISERENSIRHHAKNHHSEDIADCDSLKCIVKAVAESAKHAAHEIYGKLGGNREFDEEQFDHPKFKKPKFPKFPGGKFGKPGKNHTCHGPKHGNHSHPPPHKKPHRPLPICRFPPPPHHHKPPPPHHGHGFEGPPPHRPEFDGPPPHDSPEFDGPPPHDGPEFDGPPPHDAPEFDGPPPHDDPDFDGPPPRHGKGPKHDAPLHHDFEGRPPHRGPPDSEGPPHHGEDGPPRPPHGNDRFDQGPPGPPPPFGRPPFRPSTFGRALQITKFTAVGFLFAFLILALHRRVCTPQRRADRQARREEKHRRRAYRRAAHKRVISKILARISGEDDDSSDHEEKREALLASAEDGMSTTMTEEIEQFKNAADVVGEMINAETTPSSTSILLTPSTSPSTSQAGEGAPLMQNFETMSQIGGEELPVYEDNDGSEMSSMVADGMMGAGYTPSVSDTGSVSDILGPDVKN